MKYGPVTCNITNQVTLEVSIDSEALLSVLLNSAQFTTSPLYVFDCVLLSDYVSLALLTPCFQVNLPSAICKHRVKPSDFLGHAVDSLQNVCRFTSAFSLNFVSVMYLCVIRLCLRACMCSHDS